MTYEAYRERPFFPALDGMRAFCVLGVIATHMGDKPTFGWLAGGLGVQVFFVLSGYLITTLALREERAEGSLSLAAFYVRRSFRILPLYYLALAVVCGLVFSGRWGQSLRGNFAHALPSYILYYQDYSFYVYTLNRGEQSPFAHSWSLGVEEKFYLIWPALAFALWRGRPGRRLAGTLALLLAAGTCAALWRAFAPGNSLYAPTGLVACYAPILMGCLLAQLLDDERGYRRLRVLGGRVGSVAVPAAFVALHLLSNVASRSFPEYGLIYGVGVTALLASLLTGGGAVRRLLEAPSLQFIGRISYGMYLFHGLGISVGQKVFGGRPGDPWRSIPAYALSCAATVLVAYALALLVERRCVAWGRQLSRRIIEARRRARATGSVRPLASRAGRDVGVEVAPTSASPSDPIPTL